ncbi:MAG: DUF2812 domain-containing protein [Oscillospiraceae bacterium]|nr:DUF2812 domain-containing protein [Oscillospiraceae bacterium]
MNREIKKEIKFFLLPDYEKEEEYLTDMHKSGWKLKNIQWGGVYTFEKCQPENVVYRLDFAEDKDKDMQYYIAMFDEYGWKYIQDVNGYSYFRKRTNGLAEEDTEIFSDSESRLAMIKSIINKKLIPIWIIFFGILIPNFIKVITHSFDDIPFHTVLTVIYILLFVWCSYTLIHCRMEFLKLKKKYTKK